MKTKQLLVEKHLHEVLKVMAVSRHTTLFKTVDEALRQYINNRLKKTLKGQSFWDLSTQHKLCAIFIADEK